MLYKKGNDIGQSVVITVSKMTSPIAYLVGCVLLLMIENSASAWISFSWNDDKIHGCKSIRSKNDACILNSGDSPSYYPKIQPLDLVQQSVTRVLQQYTDLDIRNAGGYKDFTMNLPPPEREAFAVARVLEKRLQAFRRNKDCPRCWLQQAHCICRWCPPFLEQDPPPKIHRIFLLTHHKEICLAVDTAKMILASFPKTCRLVVAGIGPEYQDSMKEMLDAVSPYGENRNKCLILFPTNDAKTFSEIQLERNKYRNDLISSPLSPLTDNQRWDLVIIDGTWSQARKIHAKYFSPKNKGGPQRVQLCSSSLKTSLISSPLDFDDGIENKKSETNPGRQLRRHPIDWRTISTMEATRLLLKDLAESITAMYLESKDDEKSSPQTFWGVMSRYQQVANKAAQRQLGPPRMSSLKGKGQK